ncbi:hypothetical protein TWF481_011008 [Arthrobotrys musiformis]|uniref:Uncharacterized protein n=1 Tax=Arthrobotrys musiformis TaxID=47236 RepID=A0AAV9VY51_9PEZI
MDQSLSDSESVSEDTTPRIHTPPSPRPPVAPAPTPEPEPPEPPRPPQWDIQQINPNFAQTSSFSFVSPPKSNPDIGPKLPPISSHRSFSYKKPPPPYYDHRRPKMPAKTPSDEPKSDIDRRLHQILSTTLVSQKYAATFRQQQVCTQPSSRTYSYDDADDDGILRIAIDAEQRLKDVMDSCNSCETLGDQISKIVHGQCVELFRIRCDGGVNGERQIQGVELDLRQIIKKSEPQQVISESQSARMKLLEARMRGTDSSMANTEGDNLWIEDNGAEDLGSLTLIEGIKSLAEKYQDQDGDKRRRLSTEGEATVVSGPRTSAEAKSNEAEKKDDKSRAQALIPNKPVPLIQPRNRNSKQGPSVQMMPQPKKSKKNKKKDKKKKGDKEEEEVLDIAKIIGPMQPVTIYDAPSGGDLSLRNPQTAWAQRQGDELTITQRGEQQQPTQQTLFSTNNSSDPPQKFYDHRLDSEREKYRNLYSVQPPRERPRTNVFILYSTEDEKASPHHRTDIFAPLGHGDAAAKPMIGSTDLIEADDNAPHNQGSDLNSQNNRGPWSQVGIEGSKIQVDQQGIPRTHEDINQEIATAMHALRIEDPSNRNVGLETTLDVLRRDQERVSAEINRLLEAQEKTKEQDREVDRLLAESNIPPVKYKITQPGQDFSLSQTLDDLIDLGAQNAPSFEPRSSDQEVYGRVASTAMHMPSDGCRQPTQQQMQDWLDSITSSSTPTISTGGSESDIGEKLSQMGSSNLESGYDTKGPTMPEEAMISLPETFKPALRYPPGLEPKPTTAPLTEDPLPPLPPLPQPGPSQDMNTVKPLFERLGDEFQRLDKSVTRKGGKKQKIKSGIVKKEWTSELNAEFEESSVKGITGQLSGAQGTVAGIIDNSSNGSGLSTPEEQQAQPAPIKVVDTSVGTKADIKPEAFRIPETEFTIQSSLAINTDAPRPQIPGTPLRLNVPPSTPLKSILKKSSQFTKPTGAGSTVVTPSKQECVVGQRPEAQRRLVATTGQLYASLPFPDTPFTSRINTVDEEFLNLPKHPPNEESEPEPLKLIDKQRYQIAMSNPSELPGFMEAANFPVAKVESETEESEEETEEEKAVRRAIKGKAVDRDYWSGHDYRFYAPPPPSDDEGLEGTPPEEGESHEAIYRAFLEEERRYILEKDAELAVAAAALGARRLGEKDVTTPADAPEESSEPLNKVCSTGQAAKDPAPLPTVVPGEEEEDPFAPAEERAKF